jgi:hypothetical protein
MRLDLPVQTAVDRSVPFMPFYVEKRIVDDQGTLLEILLVEVRGSFGSLPGDPPPWSHRVDVGDAYCQMLPGYARALCSVLSGHSL